MTLTSSIPVLRVADYPAARAFWTDAMGFTVGEEGGTPPRFGIFHRDKATVFVDAWHGDKTPCCFPCPLLSPIDLQWWLRSSFPVHPWDLVPPARAA